MTEQVRGLLGSSATIPTDNVYLHNQRIGLAQVTDPDALDLRFLYHLMNTGTIRQQIQATATGSKVRHTAPERIKAVRAGIPDIAVQRRVASILDSIDDLVENNRQRVEVLEEMGRAIYREWFVQFQYPGHEDLPLVDSPLGPIPDGWCLGGVDDLVTLNKASVDPSTVATSTPAVGLEHIPRRRITLDDWGEAGRLNSRKGTFIAGDILFGKIRPYFHKVSVAPIDGICSTDAIVLRPHTDHWGQAVLSIASDEFVAHAVQTSNGTKMPRADWKVIRDFPVVIPPIEMARRFSESAHQLLTHAQILMFQARRLASLRDLILPKLVTGQIDVSNLDFDALTEAAIA
jgi:type I restriction enzyme S subunit